MPANASAKNPPEERLVNLVVALVATEQGLTKDTILSSVSGYREQSEAGASKDALEKMFERDKESLRRLGVPIETIGDWADPDDLREARYRVPTAEYELPEDIVFTSAELALLNLAGGVWSESSMSAEARSGLRKIRALGIAWTSRSSATHRASACASRRSPPCSRRSSCRASSRSPISSPARPRRAPGACSRSRWSSTRAAGTSSASTWTSPQIAPSCSRASSTTSPSPARASTPRCATARGSGRWRDWMTSPRATGRLLEVNPGTEAALRLSRRALPADQGIHVPFVDIHVFADELASYGPEVRVVEPAELRDQVIARLEAARAAHGGAA